MVSFICIWLMTWTKVSACINIQIFKILSSAVNSDELISYRQIKYVYFINKILKLICHCRASLRRKRVYLYIIFYITKVIIDRYSLSLSFSLYDSTSTFIEIKIFEKRAGWEESYRYKTARCIFHPFYRFPPSFLHLSAR